MLTYSPLSPENIDEATSLVYSIFPDEFNSPDSPEEAYRASLDKEHYKEFIQRHKIDTLEYLVAREDSSEKIIGVTGLYTLTTDSKDIVWLGWYCLDPKKRGRGFGRSILEWTINRAKEKGFKIMLLYTSTEPNEAIAQNLYEDMGFKIVKEEQINEENYKVLYRERFL